MKNLTFIFFILLSGHIQGDEINKFNALRIAHAGGGINGHTYTNSFDALNTNLKTGFQYFELDFSFTIDGHLVCLHDWKQSFNRTFHFNLKSKPTLETFNFLVENASDFKNCTLNSLSTWMQNNPSATIVTDVKDDNIKALKIISEKIPNAVTMIIPQIYKPENYIVVKNMGYKNIIWTLYRYKGSNDQVLNWVDTFNGSFAITIPKTKAQTSLAKKLREKKIPTYVHTINNPQEANGFQETFNITEIYTDFLQHNDNSINNEAYLNLDSSQIQSGPSYPTLSEKLDIDIPLMFDKETNTHKIWVKLKYQGVVKDSGHIWSLDEFGSK